MRLGSCIATAITTLNWINKTRSTSFAKHTRSRWRRENLGVKMAVHPMMTSPRMYRGTFNWKGKVVKSARRRKSWIVMKRSTKSHEIVVLERRDDVFYLVKQLDRTIVSNPTLFLND